MTIVETATTLMKGCQKGRQDRETNMFYPCGNYARYFDGVKWTDIMSDGKKHKCFCEVCEAIIKAKRECWQEELEFLLKFAKEPLNYYRFRNVFMNKEIEERIEELKQALKITESVQ